MENLKQTLFPVFKQLINRIKKNIIDFQCSKIKKKHKEKNFFLAMFYKLCAAEHYFFCFTTPFTAKILPIYYPYGINANKQNKV